MIITDGNQGRFLDVAYNLEDDISASIQPGNQLITMVAEFREELDELYNYMLETGDYGEFCEEFWEFTHRWFDDNRYYTPDIKCPECGSDIKDRDVMHKKSIYFPSIIIKCDVCMNGHHMNLRRDNDESNQESLGK